MKTKKTNCSSIELHDCKVWLIDVFTRDCKYVQTYKKAFHSRHAAVCELALLDPDLCFQIYYVQLV